MKKWFSKKEILETEESGKNTLSKKVDNHNDDFVRLGIATPVYGEEKELISVIASCIITENQQNSSIKIKNIYAIDEEKEVAAIMACVYAAQEDEKKNFKLVSIKQI